MRQPDGQAVQRGEQHAARAPPRPPGARSRRLPARGTARRALPSRPRPRPTISKGAPCPRSVSPSFRARGPFPRSRTRVGRLLEQAPHHQAGQQDEWPREEHRRGDRVAPDGTVEGEVEEAQGESRGQRRDHEDAQQEGGGACPLAPVVEARGVGDEQEGRAVDGRGERRGAEPRGDDGRGERVGEEHRPGGRQAVERPDGAAQRGHRPGHRSSRRAVASLVPLHPPHLRVGDHVTGSSGRRPPRGAPRGAPWSAPR